MSYQIGTGDRQQQVGSLPSTAAATPVQPKQAAQAGKGSELQTPAADRTNLSSLGGLVSQALAGSDVRTEKVAALQQAIATGQYSVSSSDVAEKLVQSLLE